MQGAKVATPQSDRHFNQKIGFHMVSYLQGY